MKNQSLSIVSHFPESKTTYFLEVEDYEELRGQSFSIVGHKHGTHLFEFVYFFNLIFTQFS